MTLGQKLSNKITVKLNLIQKMKASLLINFSRVPLLPKRLSAKSPFNARVPKSPSDLSARVPRWYLGARVPQMGECPNAQVP